ncbi:hypothetical protein [Leadbettera azotonutricia]|uniref:Putative outer membrane autotransporter barrel domain protein n=1 Tax=Leadbettera azotonutricia (strain ATCC BAA-888 / DSM 13862 / ZAS-9) TaxID=545695 RepID=F5Y931_LEAAZ|nr:hypothetical protein [Leadbettera azotonutricia]AEF80454.1 putative outer membrane autotransporter barrel domain protein [Leadbettera azotonutricia ZAS-9]
MKTKSSLTSRLFGDSPLLAASVLAVSLSFLILSCGDLDPDLFTIIGVSTLSELKTALADDTKDAPIILLKAVNQTKAGADELYVGGADGGFITVSGDTGLVTYPVGTVFTKADKTVDIGRGDLGFNSNTILTLQSGLTLISENTANGQELYLKAGPESGLDYVSIQNYTGPNPNIVGAGQLSLKSGAPITAAGDGKVVFKNNGTTVGALQGKWTGADNNISGTDKNTLTVGGTSALYALGESGTPSITIPAGKTLLIKDTATINLNNTGKPGNIVLDGAGAKVTLQTSSNRVTTGDTTGGTTKNGETSFTIGGKGVALTGGGSVVGNTANSYFSQFTTESTASLSATSSNAVTIAANKVVN